MSNALFDALAAQGVGHDAGVCLAALSVVLGCLCAATGDPEKALASINEGARGIIDGSLLD